MEHNKGDWLPWERCEFFCEELCGRETENIDGKKRREGRSGSGVKDRSRIDEDGEDELLSDDCFTTESKVCDVAPGGSS